MRPLEPLTCSRHRADPHQRCAVDRQVSLTGRRGNLGRGRWLPLGEGEARYRLLLLAETSDSELATSFPMTSQGETPAIERTRVQLGRDNSRPRASSPLIRHFPEGVALMT